MRYVEGFVAAVPSAGKEAYAAHAAEALRMFRSFGATRAVECWGDDVPAGKVADFRGAVQARDDETVVFAWIEFPSRAARDAAHQAMVADPRTKDMTASMPFDGKRLIHGGFAPIVEQGAAGSGRYVDGFLLAVPSASQEAYRGLADLAATVFRECGATRVVEAWGDDVPDGQVTDYRRAVKAGATESVVFSWIEWPSKEARDAGMKRAMADPRLQPDPATLPFDGQRVIFGGFVPIVEA